MNNFNGDITEWNYFYVVRLSFMNRQKDIFDSELKIVIVIHNKVFELNKNMNNILFYMIISLVPLIGKFAFANKRYQYLSTYSFIGNDVKIDKEYNIYVTKCYEYIYCKTYKEAKRFLNDFIIPYSVIYNLQHSGDEYLNE